MPKYLFHGSYTAAGAAGVLKDGGSGRAAAVVALAQSVGGSIESMYWAFGKDDFFVVADMPDAESAAALSLTVGASGSVSIATTELLTAAQVDAAAKRRVDYRPPGA